MDSVPYARQSYITGGALHCQVEHHVQDKINLLFLSCITKMDQNFIKKFHE